MKSGVHVRPESVFIFAGIRTGIVFVVAVSHVGFSEKDLMQLNTVFGGILACYAIATYLGWKLLPSRSPAAA